jgi:small subunit ribosomal protein S5e
MATTLPKEISRIGQEIKLFGKWDTQEYVQRSLGRTCG